MQEVRKFDRIITWSRFNGKCLPEVFVLRITKGRFASRKAKTFAVSL